MCISNVIIPKDIEELKKRCRKISGKTIKHLASQLNISIPNSLHFTKGLLGQIFEIYLGTNASTKSLPDFVHLGIELKTLPLNEHNKAAESTYVCTASLHHENTFIWEKSRVKQKLSHVLWVPILAHKKTPIEERIIGTPFLWQPNKEEESILKRDWEELSNMLNCGDVENLSAKYGQYLQIRPKAANSRVLIDSLDKYGNQIKVVPKGFYLRARFTNQILRNYFG